MIRIGIVDDHAIVRTGLRQFLSDHVDLRVTGEGASGHEALEMARRGDVDVLLLDISMPDQSGVDALAAIKARFPELPVLILSGFPEAHYATTLLRQGASGYLNKECDPDEIANAIRLVSRGRRYISPAVAEQLADSVVGGSGGGNDHALKYEGWRVAAEGMAERMARLAWPQDVSEEPRALVPVPM